MIHEEAIKVFDGLLNAFNESEHGDFFYDYGEAVCQAASVAISVLREQEERSKCEWCDFFFDHSGKFQFCPQCGRRLEEV